MFETATFESAGAIHTRSRNWMLATFALNSGILLTLILLPLIYPSSLSPRTFIDPIFTPPRPPAAPAPTAARASMPSSSSVQMVTLPTLNPAQPSHLGNIRSGIPDTSANCLNCGGDITGVVTGIPGGDQLSTALPPNQPPHIVHPKGPITITTGVAEGMVIVKPSPTYPAIARVAGVQGTVVLQAVISKTGAIQGLQVVSGHPMLRQAALDAVKQWRYRPYLLNGEPVEVETTINVIFSLGR